jgi:hypothetical protein
MLVSLWHYCKKYLGILIVNNNPCCQFCEKKYKEVTNE